MLPLSASSLAVALLLAQHAGAIPAPTPIPRVLSPRQASNVSSSDVMTAGAASGVGNPAPASSSAFLSTLSSLSALSSALPSLNSTLASASASASASLNTTTPSSNSTNTTRPLGTRAHHGLSPNGMQVNSIYVGFLPDWSRSSASNINQALGRSMALVGDYINVNPTSTNPFQQIDYREESLRSLARSGVVYVPAILPSFTLDNWNDTLSDALAQRCVQINRMGISVWVRFAYEMNGNWMSYGFQSGPNATQQYITAFRGMRNALVRAGATTQSAVVANGSTFASSNGTAGAGQARSYMLWSPNVFTGAADDPERGYQSWYPGLEYVDVAGLSLYFFGDSTQTQNVIPATGLFTSLFGPFHSLYSSSHPLIISESSAPFHYAATGEFADRPNDSDVAAPNLSTLTPVPANGGPGEVQMKMEWVDELLGTGTAGRFRGLTAVNFFNYFKVGSLTVQERQLLDFRYVGGNPDVETAFRNRVGNVTAYQGGFIEGAATRSARVVGTAVMLLGTTVAAMMVMM